MLDLFTFLVDAVVAFCGLTLIAIGLGFFLIIGRFLLDELRGLRDPAPIALPDDELPHVLLQIPVFNEPLVTEQALRCAAQLDWPKDRLRIQLLDDSTDDTPLRAAAVAAELRAQGVDVEHVRRPNREGFKAGACAYGLTLSDAPFVAMLDADFRPPPNWLKAAVPLLVKDPTAGFAQSRCEFVNYEKNWLTRAQGLIQDGHFLVEQRTRARAGWLFQFNGTGGIWRRATIDCAGGWSDYSLAEDLDLTVRAALDGWHGVFVSEPAIPGQVPEGIRDFRRQQRRWSNGFVQVAQRTLAPLWSAPWTLTQRIAAVTLISHQIFFPAAAIGVIAFLVGVGLHGSARALCAVARDRRRHDHGHRARHDAAVVPRSEARLARGLSEDGRLDPAAHGLSRLLERREGRADLARAALALQAHAESRACGRRAPRHRRRSLTPCGGLSRR